MGQTIYMNLCQNFIIISYKCLTICSLRLNLNINELYIFCLIKTYWANAPLLPQQMKMSEDHRDLTLTSWAVSPPLLGDRPLGAADTHCQLSLCLVVVRHCLHCRWSQIAVSVTPVRSRCRRRPRETSAPSATPGSATQSPLTPVLLKQSTIIKESGHFL